MLEELYRDKGKGEQKIPDSGIRLAADEVVELYEAFARNGFSQMSFYPSFHLQVLRENIRAQIEATGDEKTAWEDRAKNFPEVERKACLEAAERKVAEATADTNNNWDLVRDAEEYVGQAIYKKADSVRTANLLRNLGVAKPGVMKRHLQKILDSFRRGQYFTHNQFPFFYWNNLIIEAENCGVDDGTIDEYNDQMNELKPRIALACAERNIRGVEIYLEKLEKPQETPSTGQKLRPAVQARIAELEAQNKTAPSGETSKHITTLRGVTTVAHRRDEKISFHANDKIGIIKGYLEEADPDNTGDIETMRVRARFDEVKVKLYRKNLELQLTKLEKIDVMENLERAFLEIESVFTTVEEDGVNREVLADLKARYEKAKPEAWERAIKADFDRVKTQRKINFQAHYRRFQRGLEAAHQAGLTEKDDLERAIHTFFCSRFLEEAKHILTTIEENPFKLDFAPVLGKVVTALELSKKYMPDEKATHDVEEKLKTMSLQAYTDYFEKALKYYQHRQGEELAKKTEAPPSRQFSNLVGNTEEWKKELDTILEFLDQFKQAELGAGMIDALRKRMQQ